jgi:hypothetical protein
MTLFDLKKGLSFFFFFLQENKSEFFACMRPRICARINTAYQRVFYA